MTHFQTNNTDTNTAAEAGYCKDCWNFQAAKGAPKCQAEGAQKIDLVFGPQPIECFTARQPNGAWGVSGKLYESAEDNTL